MPEALARLNQSNLSLDTQYYAHDNAPSHKANDTVCFLHQHFSNRVLSQNARYGVFLKWPPYSPDLHVLDWFLFGYLKSRIYRPPPETIDDLKGSISREINGIESSLIGRVFNHFPERLRFCIDKLGGHIETDKRFR